MKVKFLILSLIILSSCNKTERVTEQADRQINIKSEIPKIVLYTPNIECFGNLSFTRKTGITAASDGYIDKIFGEVGDKIYKNQILLKIRNTQLLIQKSQIERSIDSAKTSLMLSETQIEEAKRSVEAKFLSLEKSQLILKQKLKELELSRSTLNKKEEIFALDGISSDEIDGLRLKVESLETNIESMRVDYKIAEIGFRDRDLLEYYPKIPTNPEKKKELLIELNIRKQKAEVKVAKAQVKSKEAELESLQILIDELTIRSPYTGILGARQVEVGERVKKGDDLLTTFTDKNIHAVFTIQESQISSVALGQKVEVNIPSLKQPKHTFSITQISPTVDQQSGNVTIKATSNNNSKEFIPGMFFKGKVILSEEVEKLEISESSIIMTSQNEGDVYLIRNNKIFKRKINFSPNKDGRVWVNSGLSKSDKIVKSPSHSLADGMEVREID